MNYGTALILSVNKRSYYLINNETVRTYSPQQTAYIMENSSKMSATNAPDIPAFVQTFFFISHPFYKFQLWTLETAKNLILKISRLFWNNFCFGCALSWIPSVDCKPEMLWEQWEKITIAEIRKTQTDGKYNFSTAEKKNTSQIIPPFCRSITLLDTRYIGYTENL